MYQTLKAQAEALLCRFRDKQTVLNEINYYKSNCTDTEKAGVRIAILYDELDKIQCQERAVALIELANTQVFFNHLNQAKAFYQKAILVLENLRA